MSQYLDLKENCGLDVKLDAQNYVLIFPLACTAPQAAIRKIDEMREVMLEPQAGGPQDLYYMYRDVHMISDEPLLKEYNLRYDITVIRPERLGSEFMKTAGHYHPGSFGELYEVVYGKALCMMQKPSQEDYRIIEDVILLEASAGEKIVIPSGYGHILINTGPGCLVTSNWVSSRFSSEYDLYRQAKGAAYFATAREGCAGIEYITNLFFQKLPPLRMAKAAEKIEKFGLLKNSPIYEIIKSDAKKLDFLNHPQNYDYSDVFLFKS